MAYEMKTLHQTSSHFGWDNSNEPVLEIAPGESVELDIADASGGQITVSSDVHAIAALDFARVNPVTGPIRVDGAEPGDRLVIEMLGFETSGWGWTGIIPGFGLLADEFTDAHLHISRYDDEHVEFLPGIALPTRPFTGTIGLAPKEPGQHSVVPPRAVGGNMDVRDVVQGSRLHLPVEVPGALLSVGDTHAAQGHGEVCGTAIESPMRVTLRIDLVKGKPLRSPQIETPAGCGAEHGLDAKSAYCLASVAVDLQVSEIVNAPNWLVTAYLPKGIFR